jgi:prepilin-type processing-associated H-X9-DG protein
MATITRDTLPDPWVTSPVTFLAWGIMGTNSYPVESSGYPNGTGTAVWGRPQMAGSYGVNAWMSNPPDSVFDPGDTTLPGYWRKSTAAGKVAGAPLFGDCVWSGTGPVASDLPPTTAGFCDRFAKMPSFCIPRHSGRSPINMTFVDGSVNIVGLRQLWQLPWSKNYDPSKVSNLVNLTAWLKGYN